MEAIAKEENKGAGDWEKHTKQIIDLQAEWKTIGFAPQKMNVKIFERFRAACDDFFGRKAEFFKDMKAKFAENADKKRALIEQAKALQDSTEWKSTSDKLIALQKEWKTIGMVPKRLGDQLWNEFLGACNKFFEARNAANQGTRTAERDNLQKKRDIIAQLKALAEEAGENVQEKVQQLVDDYQGIGHVPFKEKDKIYKEYHEEFLDGQKNFPKTILQKRQSELQEMLDKNVAFKKESQRLLAEAEDAMMASIRTIVAQAVEKIGQERGYAFILNTDANAATWMNPTMGEDITEAVQKLLKD